MLKKSAKMDELKKRNADRAARFAEHLARAMEAAGLTRQTLHVASDIPYDTVAKIFRGHRFPRLDTVAKLASAVGLETGVLVDGKF